MPATSLVEAEPTAAKATPGPSARGAALRLAAALLAIVMILSGPPFEAWAESRRVVTVQAGGVWPLATLATELGRRHGLLVTYEDLPRPEPGDARGAAWPQQPTAAAGSRHGAMEAEPIVVRYEVGETSGLVSDPAKLLGDAIAAQNRVHTRGRFRLDLRDGIYHLVPAAVRKADGSFRPVRSLLDVAIDLPQEERTLGDTVDAVLAAVGHAHGVQISRIDWGVMPMFCRIGFSGVPADAALEQVLAQHPVGARLVWRILTSSDPGWPGDYVVHLVRAGPQLGLASSVFEPDAAPPEWQALGPGNKPWRRLSMERAAAFVASPAEGDRIAGYNAIVERQGNPGRISADERAALVAGLLPLLEAGDSDSWYSTRVLAALALGNLHSIEAVPVLLSHLRDDFPRPTQEPGLMLPPAAIALSFVGWPAVRPIVARAAIAGEEEWQLLLRILRFMNRPDSSDWNTDVPGPTAAQAASSLLDRGATGRERERLLALVPGWQPPTRPCPPQSRE